MNLVDEFVAGELVKIDSSCSVLEFGSEHKRHYVYQLDNSKAFAENLGGIISYKSLAVIINPGGSEINYHMELATIFLCGKLFSVHPYHLEKF
jgi:hypothetical protein